MPLNVRRTTGTIELASSARLSVFPLSLGQGSAMKLLTSPAVWVGSAPSYEHLCEG